MKYFIFVLFSINAYSACLPIYSYKLVADFNFKEPQVSNTDDFCDLVDAIIEQESNFKPKAFNPEKSGSYGLMQLQCDTAKGLGLKGSCKQLFNPTVNISYGIKLLKRLEQRYQTTKDILAAYNAGRVIKYNGEYINQKYVDSVYSKYLKRKKLKIAEVSE